MSGRFGLSIASIVVIVPHLTLFLLDVFLVILLIIIVIGVSLLGLLSPGRSRIIIATVIILLVVLILIVGGRILVPILSSLKRTLDENSAKNTNAIPYSVKSLSPRLLHKKRNTYFLETFISTPRLDMTSPPIMRLRMSPPRPRIEG